VQGSPDAYTFGNTIYLANSDSAYDLGLLAHELAHVQQFDALGDLAFSLIYLGNYAFNRLEGMGQYDAYYYIIAEQQARQVSNGIMNALNVCQ
jgi:uncharacterized protein DUF4157